jgi:hypothetical protein
MGKAALIVVGAGFGLIRSLRAFDDSTPNNAELDLLNARIDVLDLALARLGERTDFAQARLAKTITKDELSETLDRVFGKLERGVDSRFERHTQSIEALRAMVVQTDELLQKVLDGLESIRSSEDLAEMRP